MKKAKIMLFALALFTVLGAALAFKAKTSVFNYCFTTRELVANMATTYLCPLYVEQKKFHGPIAIYGTSKLNDSFIDELDDCTNPAIICEKIPLLVND
jgi:hypothetical protein